VDRLLAFEEVDQFAVCARETIGVTPEAVVTPEGLLRCGRKPDSDTGDDEPFLRMGALNLVSEDHLGWGHLIGSTTG
jgi:hypothetical protein